MTPEAEHCPTCGGPVEKDYEHTDPDVATLRALPDTLEGIEAEAITQRYGGQQEQVRHHALTRLFNGCETCRRVAVAGPECYPAYEHFAIGKRRAFLQAAEMVAKTSNTVPWAHAADQLVADLRRLAEDA